MKSSNEKVDDPKNGGRGETKQNSVWRCSQLSSEVVLGLRKKGTLTSGMSFIFLRFFSFGSLLTYKISAFVPVTGTARFFRCLPGVVFHRLS
jgi:hypothetical protein